MSFARKGMADPHFVNIIGKLYTAHLVGSVPWSIEVALGALFDGSDLPEIETVETIETEEASDSADTDSDVGGTEPVEVESPTKKRFGKKGGK